MPSDPVSTIAARAGEALAPAQHDFLAACESALAQGEAWWRAQAASEEERAAMVSAELGRFAEGHVNAARFEALFASARVLDPDTKRRFEQALDELRAMGTRTDVTTVSVDPGASLPAAVDGALAQMGRAFAAARVIDHVRTGGSADVTPPIADLPFRSWSRAERRYAPPLVVTVAGPDLHAAALADFTDGRQKVVLVVDGACPPAALVRLLTPGILVMQATDPAALERIANFDGPAVAAVVPESAAVFTHDPTAGPGPWQRLRIERLPSPPFAQVPGMSAWQLREDVAQLQALAAAPATLPLPPGAVKADGGPEAVDRLASWILSQSDLTGLA